MRILIVTDAFPPKCGGSGWSTFSLARGLADSGHEVRVVKPEPRLRGLVTGAYANLEVTEFGFPYRDLPYVRNLLKDETLHRRLRDYLAAELQRRPVDVIHAQHVLGGPPSIAAGRQLGIPALVTVRDYWPVCYFTTWHVGGEQCPDCSFGKMLACMREKHPRGYWAGIPMMPYMRRSVRRKQQWLRQAATVVAVSRFVADRVVRPIVGDELTRVIPNSIDLDEVDRVAEASPNADLPERFLLFAGKLNPLKGAGFALDVLARLEGRIPLVVVGEGLEREPMERRARDQGLDVRFLPWLANHDVLRVMKRASLVIVPSRWPEPLSRVILEAMAVGVPVVASDRGGVHDQLENGLSGLVLPLDPSAFAGGITTLLADDSRRERMIEAARGRVRSHFHRSAVLPRIEMLYDEVRRRAPRGGC